jgi:hypothetical protein
MRRIRFPQCETKLNLLIKFHNHGLIVHRLGFDTVTVERGVRLPLGPPSFKEYIQQTFITNFQLVKKERILFYALIV